MGLRKPIRIKTYKILGPPTTVCVLDPGLFTTLDYETQQLVIGFKSDNGSQRDTMNLNGSVMIIGVNQMLTPIKLIYEERKSK